MNLLEFLVFWALTVGIGLAILTGVVWAVSHLALVPILGGPALSGSQAVGVALALLLVLWVLRSALSR